MMTAHQLPKLVFVATPCFGGMVTTGYMMSIVKLMEYAERHDFSISLNVLGRGARAQAGGRGLSGRADA